MLKEIEETIGFFITIIIVIGDILVEGGARVDQIHFVMTHEFLAKTAS